MLKILMSLAAYSLCTVGAYAQCTVFVVCVILTSSELDPGTGPRDCAKRLNARGPSSVLILPKFQYIQPIIKLFQASYSMSLVSHNQNANLLQRQTSLSAPRLADRGSHLQALSSHNHGVFVTALLYTSSFLAFSLIF